MPASRACFACLLRVPASRACFACLLRVPASRRLLRVPASRACFAFCDDEIDAEPDKSGDTIMLILSDDEEMPPRRARSVGSLPIADVMGHSGLMKTDDRELFTFPMWRGAARPVTVTVGDRVRCQDGVWFNDNSIAFYLRWFMEENPPPLEPQFHFSTHFFSKLTENGGMNHRNVRRWTRRVDLFRKSLVTIPIEYSKHWSLIIVANLDMIGRSDAGEFVPGIFAIDPLGTHEKGFVRIIREYLTAEWNQKKSWRACPIDLSKLPVHYPHATRQNNGDDCGVYSGVVYLTTAISIGRLKPGFSFFMSEEDAAVVEFAPGEFSTGWNSPNSTGNQRPDDKACHRVSRRRRQVGNFNCSAGRQ